MTIVSKIKARIAATGKFKVIDGAGAWASLTGEPKATPAAYVIVEEETSEENARMTGPVLQRCEVDIAVVTVARNVSDNTGGAAADEVETLKAAVRGALIGFVPEAGRDGTPITHVSGNLLKMKSGSVWHRDLFAAAFYLSEEP